MLIGIIGFGVWFDSLQKFEKIIFLTQIGGVTTDEIVYPSGKSPADYEGYQIINCLRGYCVGGLVYIPAQVTCPNTGGVTVSEFDYPSACPAPTTKTCSNGSVIPTTSTCPIPDSDGDGLKDNVDSCPNDPNNTPNGCPIPLNEIDTDGDGIFDDVDLCIFEPENINGLNDFDGCPDVIPLSAIDTDGDNIFDDIDQCINEPEVYNFFEDTDGCPDVKPVFDTDNDGIQDEVDLCPNTPFNVVVDLDGCPIPAPVIISGDCPDPNNPQVFTVSNLETSIVKQTGDFTSCLEFDLDNDGTSNKWDDCPDTVGATTLDTLLRGCSLQQVQAREGLLDDDNDGVGNNNDFCPNTRSGVTVDASGCELPVTNTIFDSLFGNDDVVEQDEVVVAPVTNDADNDGILDALDDCPTRKGTIEFDGCPDPALLDTSSPFDSITDLFTPPEPTPTLPTTTQPQTVSGLQTTTDRSGLQEPQLISGFADSTILIVVVIIGILLVVGLASLTGKVKV